MTNKPKVILLEDDPIFKIAWENILAPDVELLSFVSLWDLEEKLDRGEINASKISLILFDYMYKTSSGSHNVVSTRFLEFIRCCGYAGPAFLHSSYTGNFGKHSEYIRENFKVISKIPQSWSSLMLLF